MPLSLYELRCTQKNSLQLLMNGLRPENFQRVLHYATNTIIVYLLLDPQVMHGEKNTLRSSKMSSLLITNNWYI